MWISFAWTTKQFLDCTKTVTRRWWSESTFLKWQLAYDRGDRIHDAYDKSPRNGGKKIGQLKLTCRPYKEKLRDMPIGDLKAEGGLWNSKNHFIRMMILGAPEWVERPSEFSEVSMIRFERIIPDDLPKQESFHFAP